MRAWSCGILGFLVLTASCGGSGTPAPPPDLLFVQHSDGAVLTDRTLVLTGVAPQTGWFTDRPAREAGQISTARFIAAWGEGEDSLAEDPPNADFTCEVDDEVVNYVVELLAPLLVGDHLTYAVEFMGGPGPAGELVCDASAHLFIDSGDAAIVSLEEALRVNDLQRLSTHNSYKTEPSPGNRYRHESLRAQFDERGVRGFEIDLHRTRNGFDVYHSRALLDTSTSCETFEICLDQIAELLSRGRHLLSVLIEPKSGGSWSGDDFRLVNQMIRDKIDAKRIVTPDDVRGRSGTLREALDERAGGRGWPTLEETRGKVMFVLNDRSDARTTFLETYPGVGSAETDNVIFPRGVDEVWGSFESRHLDGARKNSRNLEELKAGIRDLSQQGYLVLTYVEDFLGGAGYASRLDEAFSSGAHLLRTDDAVRDGSTEEITANGGTPTWVEYVSSLED